MHSQTESTQNENKLTLNDFILQQPIDTNTKRIPINLTELFNFSKSLYEEFTNFFLGNSESPNIKYAEFIEAQFTKEFLEGIFTDQKTDFLNDQFFSSKDVNQIFQLYNPLPTSTIPINKLRPSIHLNSIISVPGIVTKVGNIVPELLIGIFRCNICGITSDPIFQQDEFTNPIICKNQVCANRSHFSLIDNYNDMSSYEFDKETKELIFKIKENDKNKFGDLQRIVIQEEINFQNKKSEDLGAIPRVLTCILRNELCDTIKPGDRVKLIGKMAILANNNTDKAKLQSVKSIPSLSGFGEEIRKRRAVNFKEMDFIYQLEVNSATVMDNLHNLDDKSLNDSASKIENNIFTAEQLNTIEKMKSAPNLYKKLSDSIFPSIQGHSNIKKAILLQLVSGVTKDFSTLKSDDDKTDNTRLRGDVNILLIGDPGTAKSQFLKQASKILSNSIYTTGKTSTAAGLTAAVVKDATTNFADRKTTADFSIEPGALVLADNSLCCIDEFDKMNNNDRVSIHEAMEQQTISIAKAGLHCTLNARTSILAAANPLGGRYDENKSLYQNINLSTPIFSRFDLCFVLIDEKSELRDWNVADKIIKNHILGNKNFNPAFSEDLREEDLFPIKDVQLFIESVKNSKPLIPPATQLLISKKFVGLRKLSSLIDNNRKGYKFTVRHLESIIRLSEAQAKLLNDDFVREEYVEESCRLLGCASGSSNNLNSNQKEEIINLEVLGKEEQENLGNTNKLINSEKFFKVMNAFIFLLKTYEKMSEEELLMNYLEMMVDEKGIENERDWNNEELEKEKDLAKKVLDYLIEKENVLMRDIEMVMLHPMYDA